MILPVTDPAPVKAVVGQYATYLNTGLWSVTDEGIVAPEDLTLEQLRDFLLVSGGAVYLRDDGKFGWIR